MKRFMSLPSRLAPTYTVAALVALAATILVVLGSAPVAGAGSNCPPVNHQYAGGWGTPAVSGDHVYGVRGYIKSSNQSLPPEDDQTFSVQSFHVTQTDGTGIEVGWIVGWAAGANNGNGAWYISPHPFVSLDGVHEIVDPNAIGQTTAWYSTWFDGSTQHWEVHASHGGTLLWSGSQAANGSGPGDPVFGLSAFGEVTSNLASMSGTFSGDKTTFTTPLEYYNGNGNQTTGWHNWNLAVTKCADPGHSVTGNGNKLVDS